MLFVHGPLGLRMDAFEQAWLVLKRIPVARQPVFWDNPRYSSLTPNESAMIYPSKPTAYEQLPDFPLRRFAEKVPEEYSESMNLPSGSSRWRQELYQRGKLPIYRQAPWRTDYRIEVGPPEPETLPPPTGSEQAILNIIEPYMGETL
tara:strand:- start:2361 stop:2801 length:441 start_codon:yes stop_codon:yes gene_type:complete